MTTELVELADRLQLHAVIHRRRRMPETAALADEAAIAIRALASRAGVPDGFVLVPMEATFDMEDAGLRWMTAFQHMRKQDRRNAMANAYAAMLSAAPEPVAVGLHE